MQWWSAILESKQHAFKWVTFCVLFWEMCYTSGVYSSLKCVNSTFPHWLYTHKVCCRIRVKKNAVCTMNNAARTCWISPHWVRISGNTSCINSYTCSNTGRKCVMHRFNLRNITAVFTVRRSARTRVTVNRPAAIFKLLVSLFYLCFAHTLVPKNLLYHFNSFRTTFFEFKAKLDWNWLFTFLRHFQQ